MPRPSKGPRLWFDQKLHLWYIRDGTKKRGTGCRREDRESAEKALADYIAEKYRPPVEHRSDHLLVADALNTYVREIAPTHRSKETTSHSIARLLPWRGTKMISEIRRSSCRAYVEYRTSQANRSSHQKPDNSQTGQCRDGTTRTLGAAGRRKRLAR